MKRKVFLPLLAFALLVSAVAMGLFTTSVCAAWYDWDDAVVSGNYTYLVQDGEAIILSADESISGVVSIPSNLGGYPVTTIAEHAFSNRELMVVLTIPDSVVTIEANAFENCDNLMVATIGNGVNYIGTEAFRECYNLETLTIGSKVETIDWGAFAWCESLETLVLPNSLVTINDSNWNDIGAFHCCISLKEVTLGSKLKHIGSHAFIHCSGIKSITIPNSVNHIGDEAFAFCSSLTSIDIPDSVTSLGKYAFTSCKKMTSVIIGDSVSEIANGTFSECEKLASVSIGNSVSSIGAAAFLRCTSLTEITLPNSVVEIKGEEFRHLNDWDNWGAFEDCSALKKITLNDELQSIGFDAFYNCHNLKEIVIPDSVTAVGEFAFANCSNLKKVVIGEGVTEIAKATFDSCTKLSNLKIGSAVTTINGRAFLNCVSLKSVTIPDNVVTFNSVDGRLTEGDYVNWYNNIGAFWGCSALEKVNLGKMVITISEGTFARCSKLTNINVSAESLMFSSVNGVLLNRKKTEVVYCPAGKKAVGVLPKSVVSIGYKAFNDCSGLAVWFAGDEDDRNTISINDGNQSLLDAVWHYNACADEHTYTSDCDTVCNKCSWVRKTSAKHTYTNACDTSCNVCKTTRTIKHDYKSATCTKAKTCKVCGATRGSKLGHSYEKKTTKATLTKNGVIKNVCERCDYVASKTTTIYKASKVSLSKTTYTYDGKVKKPTLTVKDSKGNTISKSNYTVTYASGRKNVGKYKVTVKFKGNYSGTKTLYFKINPAKTTLSSLTAGSKKLTVKWTKKTTQVTGYQIQYSTSKSFKTYKTKNVTSYKTASTSLIGLKAKTTYYVRVRTYKTVNGVKYYSGWSTIKYKKTK